MGTEFLFCKIKRVLETLVVKTVLHNEVDILNYMYHCTIHLIVKMVNFM